MTIWVRTVDGEPVEARIGKGVGDDLFNSRVEELLKDEDWVAKTVNDLFFCYDLYEKMKTEKGRKRVENDIREQAKCEADEWLNDYHGMDGCGWYEVDVTE